MSAFNFPKDCGSKLDQLEALAKAATPGTWSLNGPSNSNAQWITAHTDVNNVVVVSKGSRHDVAFIASANPAVVLGLIGRIRDLENAYEMTADESNEIIGELRHELSKYQTPQTTPPPTSPMTLDGRPADPIPRHWKLSSDTSLRADGLRVRMELALEDPKEYAFNLFCVLENNISSRDEKNRALSTLYNATLRWVVHTPHPLDPNMTPSRILATYQGLSLGNVLRRVDLDYPLPTWVTP